MHDFRRTRIVATIGPASGSVAVLARMMQAGMNVARLNFSHGTHEEHKDYIAHIRAASRRTGKRIGILQDLQGAKIRVGNIEDTTIHENERLTLVPGVKGLKGEIPISHNALAKDLKKGDRVLIDDGFIELKVTSKKGKRVFAKVIQGGTLSAHKGVNFPDSRITGSAFTEKDHADMLFGIEYGVDYIALSFVESASEVAHIRDIIERAAKRKKVIAPRIIAKIERKEAIESFIEILPFVDGIMIARGDLGVEIPFEEVPMVQKELVEICRVVGKPVIVATHMLESMTRNLRPTRAEVSDIANAVIDHADAVMLSAETAVGEHPSVTVQTMEKVIHETEMSYLDDVVPNRYTEDTHTIFAQTLHRLADAGVVSGIAVHASNEALARKAGVYRPQVPLFIFCENEDIARRSLLGSGVYPVVVAKLTMASFELSGHQELIKQKLVSRKEKTAFIQEGKDGKIHLTIR